MMIINNLIESNGFKVMKGSKKRPRFILISENHDYYCEQTASLVNEINGLNGLLKVCFIEGFVRLNPAGVTVYPMIQLKNIGLDLPGFALKDINLDILDNEFFALIGPTGSGKSLLLEGH